MQNRVIRSAGLCVAVAFAVGLGLAGGVAARGDVVIFNNLSTTTQGFGQVSPTFYEAQRFNSDAVNLQLTSATLTLYADNAGSGNFAIDLYSDAAGVPGAPVANLFTGPNPFAGPTFSASGDVLFSGLNQPLTANTDYWIVLHESAGSSLDIRWGSTSSLTGTGSGFQSAAAQSPNAGVGWNPEGSAHKMQLTAVPEPASACILAGVLAAAGILSRRRRHVAGVPHCGHRSGLARRS